MRQAKAVTIEETSTIETVCDMLENIRHSSVIFAPTSSEGRNKSLSTDGQSTGWSRVDSASPYVGDVILRASTGTAPA